MTTIFARSDRCANETMSLRPLQLVEKLHSRTPRPSVHNPHFRFAMAASDPLAGRFPAAVASAAGDLLASGADCRPGLAACQAWDGVKVVLGLA